MILSTDKFQRATFQQEERLKSKKLIAEIMEKGISLQEYPLKFLYLTVPAHNKFPVKVCMAVPKRRFASSVQRNLIKRRMREAWRLNKNILYNYLQTNGTELAIMIIYTGKEVATFDELSAKMEKFIHKFPKLYESNQPPA